LGVKSGLAVPIVDSEKERDRVLRDLQQETGEGFTRADLDHCVAAVQIASLAIHNRLLNRNLSALAAFSQSLTVTTDFDQILEVVASHIEKNSNGAPSFCYQSMENWFRGLAARNLFLTSRS